MFSGTILANTNIRNYSVTLALYNKQQPMYFRHDPILPLDTFTPTFNQFVYSLRPSTVQSLIKIYPSF